MAHEDGSSRSDTNSSPRIFGSGEPKKHIIMPYDRSIFQYNSCIYLYSVLNVYALRFILRQIKSEKI